MSKFMPIYTYSVLAVLSDAGFVSTQVQATGVSTLVLQLEKLTRDWQAGGTLATRRGKTPVVRLFAGREGSLMFEFDVDFTGALSMKS
jgi:hypothetical protein